MASKEELIWDVEVALEKMEFWRPVYVALLEICATREEALEALKFLVKNEGI